MVFFSHRDKQARGGNAEAEKAKQRGQYSVDGINLGILFDDYLALPASDEEQTARQRSMVLEMGWRKSLIDLANVQARVERKAE